MSLGGHVPGSLVVFLVWVYSSSQTLFFGAKVIQRRRAGQELLPARPSGMAIVAGALLRCSSSSLHPPGQSRTIACSEARIELA